MCDIIAFSPPLIVFPFLKGRYAMMERFKVNPNIKHRQAREHRHKKGLL